MAITDESIRRQSESAIKQWGDQWREHAKIHSKFVMKSLDDFEYSGLGSTVVAAANGWSLEVEMPTLVAKKNVADIMCCDKSLGHLIRHGIKPKYLMLCDANVDYEKYMKPYEKELEETILFSNVCANPKWTHNGNWKDIYFFVNMDILNSEKEFCELSRCGNIIPAGTNVSNAMIILLTRCDNNVRRNFFGYDKILLVGFDYSWSIKGNYYAFNTDGDGKANYMRHIHAKNIRGDYAYTSTNLAFSAQWLDKYINTFRLPVVQCSKDSIFLTSHLGTLSDQMEYAFKKEDRFEVKESVQQIKRMQQEIRKLQGALQDISSEHYFSMLRSVA